MERKRILIAPDKFKGSMTAAEAAAAIAEGALRVYPDAFATQFPVADGGEGTLEAAVAAGYEERLNAVAGRILVTQKDLAQHGVVAAAQLLNIAASPSDAVANAAKYLTRASTQVLEGA